MEAGPLSVRNKDGAPRFYTASGTPGTYVGKITALLTEFGCASFMVENRKGVPWAVAFELEGLAYRVRPDVEPMRTRLEGTRGKTATPETVAWAQAAALLELQLEAIETGVARASDVLGGYVLTASGQSLGDLIEERAAELLPGSRLLLPGSTP